MASKSEVLRRVPVCVRYGVLFHLPGGLCAGGTPALPGGLSSRAVVPPPRAWPKAAIHGGRIRARWRSWPEVLRRGSAGSRPHPPGSAGLTPALARRTKPAFTGWCRGLCGRDARAPGWGLCGRDARAPGWGLCGRDARAPGWSLLLPPARPLAGPSRASSNALVALWPFFVALRGNLFLSLGVLRGCPSWISYVSWLCSSATISRATSRPRSGWPGGREMAATTGWPPPP